MRIGIDVDGVLADFNAGFVKRVVDVTGKDLFGAGFVPRTWDYPEAAGYTKDETKHVWNSIIADSTFWLNLTPYPGAMDTLDRVRVLRQDHDVYFITSRPGVKAKHQTEVWLATHGGDFMDNPTVLISSEKGQCCQALRLAAYVDDRWENAVDAALCGAGDVKTFLVDRPWNQGQNGGAIGITRVDDLAEALDALGFGESQNRQAA